jgi:hypothetical protein
MSGSENNGQEDTQTLEHLLDVVAGNRSKRCAELRETAHKEAGEIVRQAHAKCRARMHRHVMELREKYRVRSSSAYARNQTMLRKQHQKADRAILDVAWQDLREKMQAVWNNPDARRDWVNAAIAGASTRVLGQQWRLEHPRDFNEEEVGMLKRQIADKTGMVPDSVVQKDIEAGIRIVVGGTVIDATLEGLLNQKSEIEADLIARIKREAFSDE